MKTNWQTKKLGDICEVVGGGTPSTDIKKYWGDDYYWVTPKDLGQLEGFVISKTERKISKLGLKDSSAKLLPVGSVILSSRAPIGYVFINTVEMATNQGCRSFICGESILNKYLYYFLTFNKEYLNKLGTGTTFKEISGSVLKEIEINLPPIFEQKLIVEILDEAFEKLEKAKENTEKNLQNSKELFGSYVESVLSDSKKIKGMVELGKLCEGVQYGTSTKSEKSGDVVVLRMGNIQNWELDWSNLMFTNNKDDIAKYSLKKGDVLFNRTNSPELVGKAAVYDGKQPAIFAGYLIRINRKEDLLDAKFLNYFLNSKSTLEYGRSVYTSSVHQANINSKKLLDYSVPNISLSEQKQIVKKLDQFSEKTKKLESLYRQKLESIEELRKSILQKAFSGKL